MSVWRELTIATTRPALQALGLAAITTGLRVARSLSLAPRSEWGRGVSVILLVEVRDEDALSRCREILGRHLEHEAGPDRPSVRNPAGVRPVSARNSAGHDTESVRSPARLPTEAG